MTWEVRSRPVQSTEMIMAFAQGARGERGEMLRQVPRPPGLVEEAGCIPECRRKLLEGLSQESGF